MNKSYIICLIIFFLTANLNGQVQELCAPQSTAVMDGEYHVSNNVWGSGSGVGE